MVEETAKNKIMQKGEIGPKKREKDESKDVSFYQSPEQLIRKRPKKVTENIIKRIKEIKKKKPQKGKE